MEEISAENPRDPQIAASEEYSDALSCHKMGPAVLTTLAHNGIDPRIACSPFPPGSQQLFIDIPGMLDAERVALHGIEFRCARPNNEGEITEEQVFGHLLKECLPASGNGRKLLQLVEYLTGGETAETDVGAEGVFRYQPICWVILHANSGRPESVEATEGLGLPAGPAVGVESLIAPKPKILQCGYLFDRLLLGIVVRWQAVEDAGADRERDRVLRLAQDGEKLAEQLVGDWNLAVVGGNHLRWIVESVINESAHIDHRFLANHLYDAVVLHGLVANLRCLEG